MNQSTPAQPFANDTWEGDVFNRKRYATFLSDYVEARVSKSGESLTIALDAAWGTGKTFFINKWSEDIKAKNGGVIVFDAWKNDFSNEVLTSFMAELSMGVSPLWERVSTKDKVATKVKEQAKSLVNDFRKAALPASAVIAKGLLKKVTGIAMGELVDAWNNDETDSKESELKELTDAGQESLKKGLETFFEKTLEAHRERAAATDSFRSALESLVRTLQAEGALNGPLYIFVDELDRCRPDYAIKLLEGIKHLFAVKGVVFVVSTNLEQLSKSVQVVYGGGFDGYSYLKRFFDFEFTLPPPDRYAFALQLLNEHSVFEGRNIDSGLFEEAYKDEKLLARSFELIAVACNLSLRTQRQVWTIASAAAVGIPVNSKMSVLWLFFLSALRHSYPSIFEKLGMNLLGAGEFNLLCAPVGNISQTSAKTFRSIKDSNGYRSHREPSETRLLEILYVYYEATFKTIDSISGVDWHKSGYPSNLVAPMVNERPRQFSPNTDYRPAIRTYQELVKMAGLIS